MIAGTRLFTRFVLAVVVLPMFWASPSPAAIPNSGPEAFTEKQFRRAFQAYNLRTMSEAYEQVGERDPKWDALALEYLQGQAVLFTNYKAGATDRVPVDTSKDRMNELALLLVELECTDPLVNYVNLIYNNTHDDQYLDRARAAYKKMQASGYPINRKLHAAWRLMMLLEGRELVEETKQIEQVWVDLMCRAVEDAQRSLMDQYYLFWAHREALIDDTYVDRWAMVCQRIDVPAPASPWLVGAICGYYHKQMAWELRGSSVARKVTEEGWRGFRKHLELAREHLVRAWEFAPRLPDVPSEMISVSMGLDNGAERMWFNRTAEAQFDYYPAYKAYLWSLRRRWGGTLPQLYEFGVECLETDRFDTVVPSMFHHAMWNIKSDDRGYNFWKRPGVYEQFITYFQGEKNGGLYGWTPQRWESNKAAVAWRLDRFGDAVAWMDGLGGQLDPESFKYFKGDAVLAPSECYARTRVAEAVFDEARKHWMDDKYRSASEVFENTLAAMEQGDPARPYLSHLSVWGQRLHQDKRGTWVDLLGQPSTVGWISRRGEWTADEQGRLTGVSDDDGLMLECRFGMGYRVEIMGTLSYDDDVVPEQTSGGMLLAFRKYKSKYYHRSVLLDPNTGEAESAQNFGWKQRYPAGAGRTNRFHIQMWDEALRLTVNDRVVFEGLMMRVDLPKKVYPFAIGGQTDGPGVELRFDELKARRLTLEPDWVPGPAEPDGFSRAPNGTPPAGDSFANAAVMRYKTRQVPGG